MDSFWHYLPLGLCLSAALVSAGGWGQIAASRRRAGYKRGRQSAPSSAGASPAGGFAPLRPQPPVARDLFLCVYLWLIPVAPASAGATQSGVGQAVPDWGGGIYCFVARAGSTGRTVRC